VVDYKHRGSWVIRAAPNLLSEIAIYHFSRTPVPRSEPA